MDNPRLLSSAQLEDCRYAKPGSNLNTAQRIALAQDLQTAALVKAATLRAVGEWLMTKDNNGPWLHIPIQEIESLRQGKWPEGWGK